MVTVKCQQCGKNFKAKRSTAKFCSSNCRVKFNAPPSKKKEAKKSPPPIVIRSTKEKPEIKVSENEAEILAQHPMCKKESARLSFLDVSHIREAAEYYEKTGMTISDLIEFHRKNKLKVVDVKESQKKEGAVGYNRFKLKNKIE